MARSQRRMGSERQWRRLLARQRLRRHLRHRVGGLGVRGAWGISRSIALSGLLFLGALPISPQALQGEAVSVQVNDVSLVYEIEGSGKPLVLIHGWAVHRGFWDGDVERFASRYTVIRYDRRGFGESSGKPDITADPADLEALLEMLGYPRVRIMGHSQGAIVALTFAVRYPEMVDALILFGAVPPDGFGLPRAKTPLRSRSWLR